MSVTLVGCMNPASYARQERRRVNALNSGDALKYARCSNNLGITQFEDPELYRVGQAELEAKERSELARIVLNWPQRRFLRLSRDVNIDDISAEAHTKASILVECHPRTYGPGQPCDVENWSASAVGGVYKKMHTRLKKIEEAQGTKV